MMYRKRKKSSLSLSINAIVILILAITMLGLGLTFMRGLFKQMESKVSEAVSASELTNPPTVDNVMTLAPSDLTLRKDKNGEVMVAFLNTGPSRSCELTSEHGAGTDDVSTVLISSSAVTMDTDQINTWLVSVQALTTEDTEIETLTMECGGSEVARKDLLIIVTA